MTPPALSSSAGRTSMVSRTGSGGGARAGRHFHTQRGDTDSHRQHGDPDGRRRPGIAGPSARATSPLEPNRDLPRVSTRPPIRPQFTRDVARGLPALLRCPSPGTCRTMRSSAGGVSGFTVVSAGGSLLMIAVMRLAWLSPANARLPSHHLVENRTQRPDVRPRVRRLALQLLGRHVRQRADDRPLAG